MGKLEVESAESLKMWARHLVQAVPSELKVQQEYKDRLIENTEKILMSVHQVPRGMLQATQ
jgi:hypothetical protein